METQGRTEGDSNLFFFQFFFPIFLLSSKFLFSEYQCVVICVGVATWNAPLIFSVHNFYGDTLAWGSDYLLVSEAKLILHDLRGCPGVAVLAQTVRQKQKLDRSLRPNSLSPPSIALSPFFIFFLKAKLLHRPDFKFPVELRMTLNF